MLRRFWGSFDKSKCFRTPTDTRKLAFEGGMEVRSIDLENPREAGWTYIVNEKDPQKEEISKILQPLAKYRGMKDPESPLIFSGKTEIEWLGWLQKNYYSIENIDKRPYYVAIVGEPVQIPFRFQSYLDMVAAVGRFDFDSLDGLKAYVDKVLRLEKAPDSSVDRKALIFAPDYSIDDPSDPTYSSHHYMAEPLAKYISDECQFQTTTIMGEMATKTELTASLLKDKPAIVYTASHGMLAKGQPLEVQKKVNGAICCQPSHNELPEKWYFTGDDVPLDRPFLEGSVFFQFACFGYGTPANSDINCWYDQPGLISEQDFVAALPKKLLSHPRGPIAFLGHLDTALLVGFDVNDDHDPVGSMGKHMEPFISAVKNLLDTQPVGLAMRDMYARCILLNDELSNFYDDVKSKETSVVSSADWLAETFVSRNDARNYMVL